MCIIYLLHVYVLCIHLSDFSLDKCIRLFKFGLQWNLQDNINQKLNRTDTENPWFVFGVSYSGALSAWFRLKFPHLTCGSLASSAVVQAVYEFPEFDQQVSVVAFISTLILHLIYKTYARDNCIFMWFSVFSSCCVWQKTDINWKVHVWVQMQIGVSAGVECKAALQEINQLVEQQLTENGKALKAQFGASEVCVYKYIILKFLIFQCSWKFCRDLGVTVSFSSVSQCLLPSLQLDVDGDFLYFLADAAVIAVSLFVCFLSYIWLNSNAPQLDMWWFIVPIHAFFAINLNLLEIVELFMRAERSWSIIKGKKFVLVNQHMILILLRNS